MSDEKKTMEDIRAVRF
jgi:hypothetical protein